jgi:hypothetical protein
VLRERLARREDLEPISVRGRAAGITTGACWSVVGVTLVWSAWYELTCPLGGPRGTSICAHTVGVGGLAVMLGALLVVVGSGVLWRTSRRLLEPEGSSGWTWGEGFSVAVAGLAVAITIPTYHCPAGYVLTPVFHACASPTSIIIDPPTRIGWKLAVAALGLVLGLVLARWRRIPWPLGSALTVATVAGATWYSIQMSVGLPSV